VLTSPELVQEFDEVMQRHGLDSATRHKWLTLLRHTHLKTPPYVCYIESTLRIQAISEDPDDNRVLECAVAGQADAIVSGDKHLRDLQSYQGISILSPREFIEQLKQER
jgi:putative PIN family toxin of toxin-antitoxin system